MFYKYVPKWISNIINTKKCISCGAAANKKNICAIGIRMTSETKSSVFVEHCCQKCDSRTITSFIKEKQSSIEDVCYLLIEEIHKQKRCKTSKKLQKKSLNGQIQDKEVCDLKAFLEKSTTFDEFLKYIGYQNIDHNET